MYNQLYAPDYPVEDHTTLERQEGLIGQQFTLAIEAAAKREDVGDWLRLGNGSVTRAFEFFRAGDAQGASKHLEAAIEYLRNASSRKPFRARFIAQPDGKTKSAP